MSTTNTNPTSQSKMEQNVKTEIKRQLENGNSKPAIIGHIQQQFIKNNPNKEIKQYDDIESLSELIEEMSEKVEQDKGKETSKENIESTPEESASIQKDTQNKTEKKQPNEMENEEVEDSTVDSQKESWGEQKDSDSTLPWR